MMSRDLDRHAEEAVRRQDVYFYDNLLKAVIGNCVRLVGIRETRRLILRYARQLKWF